MLGREPPGHDLRSQAGVTAMSRRLTALDLPHMNVSEVARRAGISPTAVRFYERRGVPPAAAPRDNGYREYH